MGKITSIQLQNSNEYFYGTYTTAEGKVYDLVINRQVEINIGWSETQLLSIQQKGEEIDDAGLWDEVKQVLSATDINCLSSEMLSISVIVGKEWFDVLERLTSKIMHGSRSSPEDALLAIICSQIRAAM